jgi:hypothetical protein
MEFVFSYWNHSLVMSVILKEIASFARISRGLEPSSTKWSERRPVNGKMSKDTKLFCDFSIAALNEI